MRTRIALLIGSTLILSACSGWYNPFAGVRALISIALLIAQFLIAYDIIKSWRSVGLKVV
jgi:hypothetical protein